MTNVLEGVLAGSNAPPWLPRDAQEARKLAYWAQIFFLVFAFIWLVIGIAEITLGIAGVRGNILWLGIFGLLMMAVCGMLGLFIKRAIIEEIDHGHFHDAKSACVIWIVFGIFAFAIPTIVLMLAYMKLTEAIGPQQAPYQPYAQNAVVAQKYPAQSYQAPQPEPVQPAPVQQPVQPVAPAAAPAGQHDHKYTMTKCKRCGVQFPAFMAACPNCGAPRS